MWRFYQTTHDKYEKWSFVDDEKQPDVLERNALHISVLGRDTPDPEAQDCRYKGDFVIDIDHKGDILAATREAIAVVEWFKAYMSPEYLELYASGGKGFHVVCPEHFIRPNARPEANLPYHYRCFAKVIAGDTGATGFDYGLYAGKRGHLIRVANKERVDGKYKVPITWEELQAMTPELYAHLVSTPRLGIKARAADFIPMLLKTRFEGAIAEIGEEARAEKQFSETPLESLTAFGDGKHPKCVMKYVEGGHSRPGRDFNYRSMQIAAYLHHVPMSPQESDRLIQSMAENDTSDTYDTVQKRVEKIQAEKARGSAYEFLCAASIAGLQPDRGMCVGCPVQQARDQAITEETGIIESEFGYSTLSAKGAVRKLTDFVIRIDEIISPDGYQGRLVDKMIGFKATLLYGGKPIATEVEFSKDAFNSRAQFVSAISEVRIAAFMGKEEDLIQIRRFSMRQSLEQEGMPRHLAAGIVRHRITTTDDDGNEKEVETKVWVEPNWSVSGEGLTNLVKFTEEIQYLKKHQDLPPIEMPDAEIDKTLRLLLRSNRPEVVSRVLGWVCATHLKEHLVPTLGDFPLLHLHGTATSGKTKTASLYSAIGSADYRRNAPLVVSNATPYPIRRTVTESNTVPRIFDEFNPTKMQASRYSAAREAIKACFSQGTASIGVLKNNKGFSATSAGVVTFRCSSPMIYCATSQTAEPELWERSVEVHVTSTNRGSPQAATVFRQLWENDEHWNALWRLAKALTRYALEMPDEDALSLYKECLAKLPPEMENRQQLCYAYTVAGLEYLRRVLHACSYASDLLQEIAFLQDVVINFLGSNLKEMLQRSNRTEVDNMFEIFAIMSVPADKSGPLLVKNIHYVRQGDVLYFRPMHAFSQYQVYCRQVSKAPEFLIPNQFISYVKQVPYFVGEGPIPGGDQSQSWMQVDLQQLAERGLDVLPYFKGDS